MSTATHEYVTTYTVEESNEAHESWIADWVLSWIDCADATEVVVERTVQNKRIEVEITVTVPPSTTDQQRACCRVQLTDRLTDQASEVTQRLHEA